MVEDAVEGRMDFKLEALNSVDMWRNPASLSGKQKCSVCEGWRGRTELIAQKTDTSGACAQHIHLLLLV